MKENKDKGNPSENPKPIWGIFIGVWVLAVFIIFFVNFIRNYLAWH